MRNVNIDLVDWARVELIEFEDVFIFGSPDIFSDGKVEVGNGIIIGKTKDDRIILGCSTEWEYMFCTELTKEEVSELRIALENWEGDTDGR